MYRHISLSEGMLSKLDTLTGSLDINYRAISTPSFKDGWAEKIGRSREDALHSGSVFKVTKIPDTF